MKRAYRVSLFALAAVVGAGCLLVSERSLQTGSGSLVSTADAIIGRPLTPLSYAGVARRTTRRAVAAGAYVGAAAAARPAYVGPAGCVQAVDPYGRIYTRCY
jgi:hypothetical protein